MLIIGTLNKIVLENSNLQVFILNLSIYSAQVSLK
jgi:hypothetical protein